MLIFKGTNSNIDLKKKYAHLDIPGRIFWDFNLYTPEVLHSLISYCEASFALYQDIGENIKNMGMASGKLMRSIACNRPVIASQHDCFNFIKEFNLGILVNHPKEIAEALSMVLQNADEYAQNCRDNYIENLSYEKYWKIFTNELHSLTGDSL